MEKNINWQMVRRPDNRIVKSTKIAPFYAILTVLLLFFKQNDRFSVIFLIKCFVNQES